MTRACRSLVLTSGLFVTIVAIRVVASTPQQDPGKPPDAALTTASGVYSAAQATRGETTFGNVCQGCHTTAGFATAKFRTDWSGRPLADLYLQINETMPEDAPGTLTAGEYAQVVAYILKLNGAPSGKDDLPSDPEALKKIRIALEKED